MGPFGSGHRWGDQQGSPLPSDLSHIFWQLYLSIEDPKKSINHVAHLLISAEISIFLPEIVTLIILRNTDIDWILIYNF